MKKHSYLGEMSKHHLVPRQRMKDYYGISFSMPHNKIRLWRLRHDAWHILFGNKTLNEIIRYLGNRPSKIYAYQTLTWHILFGDKTRREARKLLCRMRTMIRGRYESFELDPALRTKVRRLTIARHHRTHAKIYLDQQFNLRMRVA